MRARVINYPAGPVVAFGGLEYVLVDWRDVPPGFESQAEQHPYLEVQQDKPAPVTVKAEPVKAKATPKPRRTRRKAAPKGTK